MEAQSTISVGRVGDVAVVSLVGEHDMVVADEVRKTLESQLAADGGLVVSLAETQFFDSSIVRTLFAADARLRETGRGLVLHVGTPSVVERVLDVSGLTSRMRRTGSLSEAVALAGDRQASVS